VKRFIINTLLYFGATLGAWFLAYVVSFAVVAPNLWHSLAHTISIWLEGIYLLGVAVLLAVVSIGVGIIICSYWSRSQSNLAEPGRPLPPS